MAQGKIVLNIQAASKYNTTAAGGAVTGGTNMKLPDGSIVLVGGCQDSQGNFHTMECWQLTTCEDDGTGTGTLTNFTRIFVCSDRFKLPGQ